MNNEHLPKTQTTLLVTYIHSLLLNSRINTYLFEIKCNTPILTLGL